MRHASKRPRHVPAYKQRRQASAIDAAIAAETKARQQAQYLALSQPITGLFGDRPSGEGWPA